MSGNSAEDDFVSEINVTTFVDVMLVLLIIFMVTAPLMTEGLEVELPRVEAPETLPSEQDHLILTVTGDGSLFLDAYETTVEDLASLLRTRAPDSGRLFIRADAKVTYGLVMEVMSAIRGAGLTNVGLVAAPSSAGGGDSVPAGADAAGSPDRGRTENRR